MSRVLVLGAGMVAGPLIRYLLERGHELTVAAQDFPRAQELVAGKAHGKAVPLDAQDEKALGTLVRSADLTVSLLPFALHPSVAKQCLAYRKPMVTTSYVSETMQAFDREAKDADVLLLNEMGLDPGIDHMSAMRIIDAVRTRGGRITSFRSFCGGLPAPDANDNPLGYKFSWAPRGVLLASRNGAQYLVGGRKMEVAPERLFRDMHLLHVPQAGDFEAYPNRDSLGYIEIYRLSGVQTMLRGTLRNMGWCDCMYNFRRLGLLELDEVDVRNKSYADLMCQLLGCASGADLRKETARKLGIAVDALPVANLEWLGMFSQKRFGVERIAPLDALGALMLEKLQFKPGERDMVVLHHELLAEYPDGRHERITSDLVQLGIEGGDSAMSQTVSLPAAVAAQMILDGQMPLSGVLRPVQPSIYGPVLEQLARLGIEPFESVESY